MNALPHTSDDPFQLLDAALCRQAGLTPETSDEDALVGFFQNYRGQDTDFLTWHDGIDAADELSQRLDRLFQAAGEGYRPGGGRDAYFVVRQAPPLDPQLAENLAGNWFNELQRLAPAIGDEAAAQLPAQPPKIRVLEGVAPKQTRPHEGRTAWLKAILEDVPQWTEQLHPAGSMKRLRQAYYFIACDGHVRDHLMWPLYRNRMDSGPAAVPEDPFADYFELWCHGVKLRSYAEGQVDVYLPRR
ncbi:MAG: apolipoprotein acyltransferase [Planctomycetota bacterium]